MMAPLQNDGYWGKPTSTIDWCENNYEVNHYIAEFWNTISNLVMIIPPIWGAILAWRDQLGLKIIFCHISLMVVGIGSWCFHMTLQFEMQLFDELPMVWATCFLMYCLIGLLFPPNGQRRLIEISVVTYAVIVTVVYVIVKKPLFHEVTYGILVALTFLIDLQMTRAKIGDVRLFIAASTMYMTGFVIWNIDNVFCSKVTSVRSMLPDYAQPFTQLHAWWHCLAGYATYLHILFCSHAHATSRKEDYKLKFDLMGLTLRKFPLASHHKD